MNLDELDRVLDGARQAPLSEDDYEKLKDGLACPGGDAGAVAQHGEDQRGAGKDRKARKTGRRDSAGDQCFPSSPDMDAMVQRRLSSAREDRRLRTRS